MTMHHSTINSTDDIPDLCKSTFFTKEKLFSLAWILVLLFMGGYGVAVGYALNNSVNVTKLESKVAEHSHSLYILNEQINKKLDILVKDHDKP